MAVLTQARLRELLAYDPATGIFVWKVAHRRAKAGDVAGYAEMKGYRAIKINGKRYSSHRLAWLFVYGSFPRDCIDHIDGVKGNNRIENLREAIERENNHNVIKLTTNASGYLGVCWHKRVKKWIAQVHTTFAGKKKKIYLGMFTDIADAVVACERTKILG